MVKVGHHSTRPAKSDVSKASKTANVRVFVSSFLTLAHEREAAAFVCYVNDRQACF